jgi:hypothetical protein
LSRNLDKNAFTAEKFSIKQGLPVKKKTLFITVFLSILLWSILLEPQFVNPIAYNTFNEPPIITIESPLNNETFSLNNVLFVFTLTKPEGDAWIDDNSAWAKNGWTDLRNKVVYIDIALDGKMYDSVKVNSSLSSPFNFSMKLANLEDGIHSVQIHTLCEGVVLEIHGLGDRPTSYSTSSDVVYFSVDTTPPEIEVTSIENKPYKTTEVPLIFTINEPKSQMTYSLDGRENVTIAGNTTLTVLSYGVHNLTVYATDEAGNTGVSETIYFSVDVPEPFPTATVVAVSVAAIALVSVGLLVYFKKRKY